MQCCKFRRKGVREIEYGSFFIPLINEFADFVRANFTKIVHISQVPLELIILYFNLFFFKSFWKRFCDIILEDAIRKPMIKEILQMNELPSYIYKFHIIAQTYIVSSSIFPH